jgi:hypothetical protein
MFGRHPALQKVFSGVRSCMRWSKLHANWYLYQPSWSMPAKLISSRCRQGPINYHQHVTHGCFQITEFIRASRNKRQFSDKPQGFYWVERFHDASARLLKERD